MNLDHNQNYCLQTKAKEAIELIKSSDEDKQLQGVTMIRKNLSIEINPPIDTYTNLDAIPLLIELTKSSR